MLRAATGGGAQPRHGAQTRVDARGAQLNCEAAERTATSGRSSGWTRATSNSELNLRRAAGPVTDRGVRDRRRALVLTKGVDDEERLARRVPV